MTVIFFDNFEFRLIQLVTFEHYINICTLALMFHKFLLLYAVNMYRSFNNNWL